MTRSLRRRAAFSLLELLVVIVIIVSLMLIALPAFNNMQESQKRTSAASLLQQSVSAARDAAISGGTGEDTAAVFTFEPGGRTTVITCVKVGTLADIVPQSNVVNNPRGVTRDVFAPLPSASPVSLPEGFMVRGYAPGEYFDFDWYETSDTSLGDNRYPQPNPRNDTARSYWVFPETGFYDHRQPNVLQRRQTFMVRFEGSTGHLSGMRTDGSIVVMPRSFAADREGLAIWKRPDRATDLRAWARRILETRDLSCDGAYALNANSARLWDNPDDNLRRQLIGSGTGTGGANGGPSTDIVLAKPLTQLALYDENKLASALGVRAGRYSGCLYEVTADDYNRGLSITSVRYAPVTNYTANPSPAGADNLSRSIGRWIEGYLQLTGNDNDTRRAASTDARMFVVDRYTGSMLPLRIPNENSEGVDR